MSVCLQPAAMCVEVAWCSLVVLNIGVWHTRAVTNMICVKVCQWHLLAQMGRRCTAAQALIIPEGACCIYSTHMSAQICSKAIILQANCHVFTTSSCALELRLFLDQPGQPGQPGRGGWLY